MTQIDVSRLSRAQHNSEAAIVAHPIMIGRRGPTRSTRRPPSDMPSAVQTAGTMKIVPTRRAVYPRKLSSCSGMNTRRAKAAPTTNSSTIIARRNDRLENMRTSISGWSMRNSWRTNHTRAPDADRDAERGRRRSPAPVVALGDAEHGDGQTAAAGHEAAEVERAPFAVADGGEELEAGHENDGADGQVDEEQPVPADRRDEPAAERRSERRCDHRCHAPHGDGSSVPLSREEIQRDCHADGHHRPAAQALEHTTDDQHGKVG